MGKFANIRRLMAAEGLGGVFRAVSEHKAVSSTASFIRYWLLQHDYRSIGKLASIMTETVFIERHRFVAPRALVDDVLRCRMLLGRYEGPERALLRRYLDPSRPVVELGGGLGIVASIINRRLRDPQRHVVLEANPHVLPALQTNRSLNEARFTVVHAAIGYTGSHTAIQFGSDFLATRTRGRAGETQVPATTLQEVLTQFPYEDCVLVCDIEGAEVDLVDRESQVLAQRVSLIVMEEHPRWVPERVRASMFGTLRDAGFVHLGQIGDVHAFRNART